MPHQKIERAATGDDERAPDTVLRTLPWSDWIRIWCTLRPKHLPPPLAREIQFSIMDMCAKSWIYLGPLALVPSALTSTLLLSLDRPFSRAWLGLQVALFVVILSTAAYVRRARADGTLTPARLNLIMVGPACWAASMFGVLPYGITDDMSRFYLASGLLGTFCAIGFFWTIGHWPISLLWAVLMLTTFCVTQVVLDSDIAGTVIALCPFLVVVLITMSGVVSFGLVESRYHLAMARDSQHLIGLLVNDYERGGHDFLWETDADLRLTHVPPRMTTAGHGDPAIAEGGSLWEAISDDEDALEALGAHRPFQALVNTRGPDGVGELRLWGHPKIISGEYLGYRGVGSDEDAARRAANAETISERLDAIVTVTSGLAHDFNNQLASVLGAVELIGLDTQLSEASRAHARRAIEGVLRSRRLTTDLVVAAGHDATYQSMNFDLNDVVHAVIEDVAPIFPDVSIYFQYRDAVVANTDPSHFERALRNLIQNACQAFIAFDHGDTAPSVLVETRDIVDSRRGPTAEVRVTDNGPGIPAEVLDRVFEPFVSTRRTTGGTGLGLAVARGFAVQAGGALNIVPTTLGTCFSMLLPLSGKDRTSAVSNTVLPGQLESQGHTTIEGHFVIVDDDQHVADNLFATIAALGGTAEVAHSVDAAHRRFSSSVDDIDCVISDLVLSDGEGFQVVEYLRDLNPTASAIYMSGFSRHLPSQAQDKLRCPFVAKPFSTAELLQALSNAGVEVTYSPPESSSPTVA